MTENAAIKVTILLATYNGAKYVGEQLDSLLNQTYTNWELLIRDDKSSDATPAIIASYQAKYPEKISVVNDSLENVGSTLNFSVLLQAARRVGARYIMLCDQDDFWLPDKIACTLTKMESLEDGYGKDFPVLVHTNFHYANANLEIIKASQDFQANKISDLNFCHLLAQNPVYGCTTMINKRLADLIGSIPPGAENHDYWIAMVASAFGKIFYLDKKTILYRQHGNNISGSYDDNSFYKRFKRIIIQRKSLKDAEYKIVMADLFKSKYGGLLRADQMTLLDDFIDFSKNKRLSSIVKNMENGVRRQTRMQTLLFYVSVYFAGK